MENGNFVKLNINNCIVDNFLFIPDNFLDDYNSDKTNYWIYGIFNKDNKMKPLYIGKTFDINRRARQYYKEAFSEVYDNRPERLRPIVQHMSSIGSDNFIMVPLLITSDENVAVFLEVGAIVKYDTINYGFNSSTSSAVVSDRKPASASNSKNRSKLFFILNPNKKLGYITTGLKLAGQIMGGVSKDNVKTAAKRGVPRKGFFMYYLSYTDFETVKNEVKRKLDRGIFNGPKNSVEIGNSQEAYKISYENFLKYGKYIKKFLKNGYNPEDIDIKYVTQDDSELGYSEESIKSFLIEYSKYPLKIYNGESEFDFE